MKVRTRVAAGLLAVATITTAEAATSPRSAVLHARDVPSNLHLNAQQSLPNATMAQLTGISLAQFVKHGRISGYLTQFQAATVASPGVAVIQDSVYAYRKPAGAAWDYVQSVYQDAHHGGVAVRGPKIGTESTSLSGSATIGGRKLKTYALDFHVGTYDVSVMVAGARGQVRLSDAVHYARVIAKRLM